MSDLTTATAALLAKKGADYFAEFTTWANTVRDSLNDFQASLLATVTATSTTSATLGTGTQSLTLTAGDPKSFAVGQRISAAYNASNYMIGVVSAYDDGTRVLTFEVASANDVKGSGTYTAWTVSLSGDEGPAGPTYLSQMRRTGSGTLSANEHTLADLSATANFTLPLSPAEGTIQRISDIGRNFDAYQPVVLRNGQTIMSLAENMTLTTAGRDYWFMFINSTWRLLNL